jgi:hypothetical protein
MMPIVRMLVNKKKYQGFMLENKKPAPSGTGSTLREKRLLVNRAQNVCNHFCFVPVVFSIDVYMPLVV